MSNPACNDGEREHGRGKREDRHTHHHRDVDAYHAQLKQRKVAISDPLTLQWWGDKTFKVTDPCGYEIGFYQKIGEPKPPQGMQMV